jgi:hypothetical protein
VDHPVASHELIRPWRTATVIATGVATLELVLIVIGGLMLIGRSVTPHAEAAAKRDKVVAKPAAATKGPARHAHHRAAPARHALPRGKTRLVVLNGNGVSGAAAETAAVAKSRGYVVKEVGNAPRTGYPRTMVMYRPPFRAEGLRLAHDMGLSLVGPLDGMRPAQLHGAQLVVRLGASR